MVGHEAAHDGVVRPREHARRGVVDGFVQSVVAKKTISAEGLQIATRVAGDDRQRECGRVGSDDQILRQSALEAQPGDAERSVLIDLIHVDGVVARLRDAPRNVTLPSVLDLARDGALAGLLQQRVLVAGQEQPRHEVLEHRAAPRDQADVATMTRKQAAQSEPVFLGHLALRDEQETRQAGFRCQQVVPARISPPLAHVVADAQQVSRRIVEEIEIHRRQLMTPGDQTVDDPQPLLRRGSATG